MELVLGHSLSEADGAAWAGSATCLRCGRIDLALDQTICTEEGLICDPCAAQEAAERDSAEAARRTPPPPTRTDNVLLVLEGILQVAFFDW
jgi:hypothetical protein